MTLLVVRHGVTEQNQRGLLLGSRADPGLAEEGQVQAQAVALALGHHQGAAIVSSPLRRCLETAEAIAQATGSDVAVDDRLVEIDYGEWEGIALADIPPETSERWRADGSFRPPGGETLDEVGARVAEWCEELDGGRDVIAVTHVSPVKAAVAWAIGGPATIAWRLFVAVASITTIGIQPHGPVLVAFNDTGHLRIAP